MTSRTNQTPFDGIPTYESFDAYLGKKDERPLAKNTRVRRTDGLSRYDRGYPQNSIAIRLHATDIIVYFSDGNIQLSTGGWYTDVTARRIEQFSPFSIRMEGTPYEKNGRQINCESDGLWYVSDRNDVEYHLDGEVRIQMKLPSIEELDDDIVRVMTSKYFMDSIASDTTQWDIMLAGIRYYTFYKEAISRGLIEESHIDFPHYDDYNQFRSESLILSYYKACQYEEVRANFARFMRIRSANL